MTTTSTIRGRRRIVFGGALTLLVAATLLVAPAPAAAVEPPCPTTNYITNYPWEGSTSWSEALQGIAHDDGHWFITQTFDLWKIPVELDLNGDIQPGRNGVLKASLDDSGLPEEFNHFGDADQYGGYVYIAVEAEGGRTIIAAFRASDLSLASYVDIVQDGHAAWVAVGPGAAPGSVALYSSGENPTSFVRYPFDAAGFAADPAQDLAAWVGAGEEFPLYERDGTPITRAFKTAQGGVFTPHGDLYFINGSENESPEDARGGIHLFDRSGRLIEESRNEDGEGGFKYAYNTSSYAEEPEGIDYWDREFPAGTNIEGDLHAFLLDNDWPDEDDVYLKHYDVDYSCAPDPDPDPNLDTDGDGLTDGHEGTLGTDPTKPDTDGDGLTDAAEPSYGTDPTNADSDGDGLGDGADVEFIQASITSLPDSAFKPNASAHQQALLKRLDAVEASLLQDNRRSATNALQSVLLRADGCGAVADRDDSILDCSSQVEVRALVQQLVDAVSS